METQITTTSTILALPTTAITGPKISSRLPVMTAYLTGADICCDDGNAIPLVQPCPTRRPRYTFLAPSISTLFESIININSNFKTKNIFECLSTVKYFHKIFLKHGTVLDIP
jgi:hypothetical protein